jgi:hypothetical protein
LQELGRNVGLFAAGLLALLVAGFWIPYLSAIPRVDSGITLAVHMHAAALFGWAALMLVQPLAIYARAHRLHRVLGRVSLAVMALVVLTSVAMLHREFQERIQSGSSMREALTGEYLSATQLLLVAIAYAFSVIVARRRNVELHWRLMLLVVLLLLPAGLARTLGYWFDVGQVISQSVCAALNLMVLGALAIHDLHARKDCAVYDFALAAYITMLAGWAILGRPV